jgi:hypothetical protein
MCRLSVVVLLFGSSLVGLLADTKWSVVDVDLLTSNKRVWRVIMTSLNMRTLYSTVIRAVISYEDSDDVFLAYLRNDTQTRKYTDYSTS